MQATAAATKPAKSKAAAGRKLAVASEPAAASEPAVKATARVAAPSSSASKPSRSRGGAATAAARRASVPASSGERHQNEGHGRRLTMAFEALEAFPALAESRDRLLAVISKDHVATADIVAAVESDVALSIAVLRLANRANDGRARVDTAVAAVELLSPQTVQAVANRVRTFDFFERASVWDAA